MQDAARSLARRKEVVKMRRAVTGPTLGGDLGPDPGGAQKLAAFPLP